MKKNYETVRENCAFRVSGVGGFVTGLFFGPSLHSTKLARFLSGSLIIRVPFFSCCSASIREPYNRKGKRVLLRNLLGGPGDLVSGLYVEL